MASTKVGIAEPQSSLLALEVLFKTCPQSSSIYPAKSNLRPEPEFCPETIIVTKLRAVLEGIKYLFGDSDDAKHFCLWKLLSQWP